MFHLVVPDIALTFRDHASLKHNMPRVGNAPALTGVMRLPRFNVPAFVQQLLAKRGWCKSGTAGRASTAVRRLSPNVWVPVLLERRVPR